MRLLFIGDVVGKPGRNSLSRYLSFIEQRGPFDLTIANGENAAGGAGITEKVFEELIDMGIEVVTGGNHIWDRKEVFNFIDHQPRLLRPANLPPQTTPGNGSYLIENMGIKTAIINLIGRTFMNPADCPFRTAEKEIASYKGKADIIIVDFHAEATSEKQALGWFLDGRVSAVIGTHTHVQTADERILPRKTAYISDAGMVGLYDSVLGVDRDGPLQRFITQLPCRLEISEGRTVFNAVIVDIDEKSGAALRIERIFEILS